VNKQLGDCPVVNNVTVKLLKTMKCGDKCVCNTSWATKQDIELQREVIFRVTSAAWLGKGSEILQSHT
jgi:hypothetical protein